MPPSRAVAETSTTETPSKPAEKVYNLAFEGADLETVMEMYCEWVGRIMLKTDAVKATVTIKAEKLTKQQCIEAVDAVLAMNNIALIPVGEKFIKVVPATQPDLTGQGLIVSQDPSQEFDNTARFVTHIIQLKHVQFPEIQAAIQHLMHSFGKIQTIERTNSMMITDTASNMRRIRELIDFVDQPSAKIEPRIYQIQYAKAAEIASKINEVVQMAQADQQQRPGALRAPARPAPAGVIRAPAPSAPEIAEVSRTEAGADVIIRGTVKVMPDDRTNIIMIFSQPENFDFFDQIIKVFDVEVAPAISYEVVGLEYADAEEIAGTLNELVGAAQDKESRGGQSPTTTERPDATSAVIRQLRPVPSPSAKDAENLSQLSDKTKILADKRSNSLLLMGQQSDIAAIKAVIGSLDIMLEQVLIEAAIFEIGLDDGLSHGIEWLYQNSGPTRRGGWDAANLATNTLGALASGALSYWQQIPGINTQIAIKLAANDGNSRLLSTPVIMTTDNTEAKLSIGEQRPVVTSTDSFGQSSGTQRSSYEYKDIGIQLTVTPRINPKKYVIMEIKQKADQLGQPTEIDGNQVPVIKNREFEATITVPNGGTVALGGLMSTEKSESRSKIPILGDIPFIGRYLFSSTTERDIKTELLILMTPHVLNSVDEMGQETERLYRASSIKQSDWRVKGWSGTRLQNIPDAPEDEEAE